MLPKFIIDLEPVKFGAAEEEMTLPQAAKGEMAQSQSGKLIGETEAISI